MKIQPNKPQILLALATICFTVFILAGVALAGSASMKVAGREIACSYNMGMAMDVGGAEVPVSYGRVNIQDVKEALERQGFSSTEIYESLASILSALRSLGLQTTGMEIYTN